MKRFGCLVVLCGLVVLGLSPQGRGIFATISDLSAPELRLVPDRQLFGPKLTLPFDLNDRHPIRLRYHFDENEAAARELEAPSSPLQLETTGLADGPHVLRLKFSDRSFWKNSITAEFPFQVDRTPPSSELLSPDRIWTSRQGDVLLVFIRTNKPIVHAEAELVRRPGGTVERLRVSFFEVAPLVWCVLRPVDIETPPEEYTDRFFLQDAAGNETIIAQRTRVLAKPLKDGNVNLSASILQKLNCRTLEDQEALRKRNNDRIAEITAAFTEERYFRGPFIRPARGEWTSPYGQNRLYDGKVWHRHLGTDLADVAGAEVFAANDGMVVLSEDLGIYGNCVVLDHGRGIFTLYGHNSLLKVKPGDRVKKGDSIAVQGETGLAGGIHLHLSTVVGKVYVAPDIFIQKFEGFENALAEALGVASDASGAAVKPASRP